MTALHLPTPIRWTRPSHHESEPQLHEGALDQMYEHIDEDLAER